MGSPSRPDMFSAATLALTPPIDTALPLEGLSLDADLYIARYARSFAIDGRNSAIQILPGPCPFNTPGNG